MSNLTAANDAFLREVRVDWNDKIYKKTRASYNKQGFDAAVEYLLTFIKPEYHTEHAERYTTIFLLGRSR